MRAAGPCGRARRPDRPACRGGIRRVFCTPAGALARALCGLLLLLALPARAGWVVAESANFRLFAPLGADEAAARVAELEDYRALLVQATGRALPAGLPRLDVYLVPDLAAVVPGQRLPPGIAGFYRATFGGIAAFVSTAAGAAQARTVLLHEYAHHFMFADTRVAYPAWYVEGFADYFMTARLAPDRIEFGHPDPHRLRWIDQGQWLRPEALLRAAFDRQDPRQAELFYAQSWLLTHWLFRTRDGPAKLRAYLARTGRGEDPVEAFRSEILPDLDRLERTLRRYREDPRAFAFFRAKRAPPAQVPVAVRPLPSSAETLLLPRVVLAEPLDPRLAPALLVRIRTEAARFPEDPFATATLAIAELQHGDARKGTALLDALVAASPADPELLRWRAAAALAVGEGEARARAFLARALAADPADWRALAMLAGTLPAGAPERFEAIARAWVLAPQVPANVLAHAHALAEADRLSEAEAVLQPLAWSPHGGALAGLAERLRRHAAQGDRAAFLAALAIGGPAQPR